MHTFYSFSATELNRNDSKESHIVFEHVATSRQHSLQAFLSLACAWICWQSLRKEGV
jgi:hypothetical protein